MHIVGEGQACGSPVQTMNSVPALLQVGWQETLV